MTRVCRWWWIIRWQPPHCAGLLNTARLWEAQATALGRDRQVTVFEPFVADSLDALADGLAGTWRYFLDTVGDS